MTTVVGTPPGVTASGYRAGPWTPAKLTGRLGWWDADDASTFTYSSGVVVSEWADKSGQGKHLVVSNAAPSRSGLQNGRATVVFGGTHKLFNASFGSNNVPLSFAWFGKPSTAIAANDRFISIATSETGIDWNSGTIGAPVHALTTTSIAGYQASAARSQRPMTLGSAIAAISVWDAANTTMYTDGVAGTTVASAGLFAAPVLRLGYTDATSNNFKGDVFEIVICSGVWSATDRANLFTYARTKWGTP